MNLMKTVRASLGMKQHQLAEALGITQPSVSKMERGKLPIDRRTELALERLASEAAGS